MFLTETHSPTPPSPASATPPPPHPCVLIVFDSHYGWAFAGADDPPLVPPGGYGSVPSGAGVVPDPLHDFKTVRQIYEMAVGEGALNKYTVPILWDEKVRACPAFVFLFRVCVWCVWALAMVVVIVFVVGVRLFSRR